MLTPEGTPGISIDDLTIEPQCVCNGKPRWIDYGVAEISQGFTQLRIRDLPIAIMDSSYLLITDQLNVSFEGLSLEEAERTLWGIARCDAGRTTLRSSRVTVGVPATFTVRYDSGPHGLQKGALVYFHVPAAFDWPQTENPHAPGYTTITNSDANVRIVDIGPCIASHEKTVISCRLEDDLGPGEGFTLSYHVETPYIFTCIFHKTDIQYWFSKIAPLTAFVAVSDDSQPVSLTRENGHALEFVAGPPERLHLFLPGRRRVSDSLTLRGVFTDHFRNTPICRFAKGDVELWLDDGKARISLGMPESRFIEKHRFEIPLPQLKMGVYRALAYRRGTNTVLAQSNPLEIIAQDDAREPIYWGEIHGHTEMSDGLGAYPELYRHARDEGCLDFAAAADHACYHSDNDWLWMQDITNVFNCPGCFVTLVGYEWAGKQSHRNVYTSRDRLKLFRGLYPPTSNLDVVYSHFHDDAEVVAGPHAPLAHGLSWEHHDPEVERFVEVYSVWGASESREGPLAPIVLGAVPNQTTVDELLQKGTKLGFTGGGDCHEGRVGFAAAGLESQGKRTHTFAKSQPYHCGMTAAIMSYLDREKLVNALRNRRTYATTGPRILIDFAVAGLPMGTAGKAAEALCRATVHAETPLERLQIIRDGKVVYDSRFNGLDATLTWNDPITPECEHYYYLRVAQADGQLAWSSPVWIKP